MDKIVWDSEGVSYIDYLQKANTMTGQYYAVLYFPNLVSCFYFQIWKNDWVDNISNKWTVCGVAPMLKNKIRITYSTESFTEMYLSHQTTLVYCTWKFSNSRNLILYIGIFAPCVWCSVLPSSSTRNMIRYKQIRTV